MRKLTKPLTPSIAESTKFQPDPEQLSPATDLLELAIVRDEDIQSAIESWNPSDKELVHLPQSE